MSDDQEAFERAERAWEELRVVKERRALQSEDGRRSLHALKGALDALTDFTQRPAEEAAQPAPPNHESGS